MPRPAPELIEAAMVNLQIACAPFMDGCGMTAQRQRLRDAMKLAAAACNAADEEDIKPDWAAIRRLADQADAEAKNQPGYRPDIDV